MKLILLQDVKGQGKKGEIIEANIAGCKKLTLRILDGGDGYTNDSSAFGNPVLTNPEADAT